MSQHLPAFSSNDIRPCGITYDSAVTVHKNVELFVKRVDGQQPERLRRAVFDEAQKTLKLDDVTGRVTPELGRQIERLLIEHRDNYRTAEGRHETGSASLNKILTTNLTSVIAKPVAAYPNQYSFPCAAGENLSAYADRLHNRFPNLPQNDVQNLLNAAKLQTSQRRRLT